VNVKKKKTDKEDFKILETLGSGTYAKVYKVQKKVTREIYAMKCLVKENLMFKKEMQSALTERNILKAALHPFIVQLHYAFQSEKYLFFVMDFLPGGELQFYLWKYRVFAEKWVKFFAAEILLGLDYLHSKMKVIYRDMKPENILLDAEGHIRLTDFGLSYIGLRASTTCGTPQYIAPEVINESEYGKEVDFWGLGCIIFEMLSGKCAFDSDDGDRESIFTAILEGNVHYPEYLSKEAKDLISKLLCVNPAERLGANSVEEIKEHPFFNTIDWNKILQKKVPAPFKPNLDGKSRAKEMRSILDLDDDDLPTLDLDRKLTGFTYDSKLPITDQTSQNSLTFD